jgi:sporulation protein YlmC with PRC-barrel domain
MTKAANHRTSVSALAGSTVVDVQGSPMGLVSDLAVSPGQDSEHVYRLLVRRRSEARGTRSSVPVAELQLTPEGRIQLREGASLTPFASDDPALLLERDLLDQQIIDINGHKVVRVNDVDLIWESSPDNPATLRLRIAEVEIGLRGAVRRVLKGLPPATVDRIARRFRPSAIPWNYVDLIDRDPARRVKLKIEQDRLSNIHPSDLADILEDLAPAERQVLFESLNEEVAAEALEEVNPRMQQTLLESLDSEQVAGIVEEMDPGAAADLLSELSDERSEAILEEMDPEERQEVEELLEFSGDSAAGRMTTDYLALQSGATVTDAVAALRVYEGDVEAVTEAYLLDEDGRIAAIIPLVQLLMGDAHARLEDLPDAHIVSCNVDANGRKVAELFDKYNLRALPVVDHDKKMVGVVHADQVIALLRAKT